jgi:carboxypeptidase Taq
MREKAQENRGARADWFQFAEISVKFCAIFNMKSKAEGGRPHRLRTKDHQHMTSRTKARGARAATTKSRTEKSSKAPARTQKSGTATAKSAAGKNAASKRVTSASPAARKPVAGKPVKKTPGAKTPGAKTPGAKAPVTKALGAKTPVTKAPAKTPAAKKAAPKTVAAMPRTKPAGGTRSAASGARSAARPGGVRRPRSAAGAVTTPPKPNDRRTFEERFGELKSRLQEIADLGAAGGVLHWDQATYMPPGAAEARGRQSAMLAKLGHEKAVDPALGRLLDGLARDAGTLPPDSDDASLIRVARRDFEKANRVPAEYVERSSELASASYVVWTKARPANDFAAVQPWLEKNVELSREYAGYFGPWKRITDPMIDDCDAGMTTESVQALFADLRRELVPVVQSICDQPPADDGCLRGAFMEAEQHGFNVAVAKRLGYDFERGRLDKTHHPFCTRLGAGDVRITTRFDEGDIGQALFSTIHEAGHAMYEQGVAAPLAGTLLGHGTSAGVHESQSRLWENVVGRGRGFWQHFYPSLQDAFPGTFRSVEPDTFYRAINKVQRSLIRTDADEVTYNLHVMMRFDLELDLLEGRLEVKDLPEAWRARIAADLGITPPDDRDGCLQDVHWYNGGIGGGFQGYTIGNILSAQFYAAAVKAHPEIPDEIARGEFGTLRRWLVDHIYTHGRKFDPDDLVMRATGENMTIAPYVAYLRGKYGELYRLSGDDGEAEMADEPGNGEIGSAGPGSAGVPPAVG